VVVLVAHVMVALVEIHILFLLELFMVAVELRLLLEELAVGHTLLVVEMAEMAVAYKTVVAVELADIHLLEELARKGYTLTVEVAV
jgi:hypothetical protein